MFFVCTGMFLKEGNKIDPFWKSKTNNFAIKIQDDLQNDPHNDHLAVEMMQKSFLPL